MKKRTVLVVCVVLAVILVALSYEGIRGRYRQVTQESQEWAEYQQKKKDGQWVAERLGEVKRWKYPAPPKGMDKLLSLMTLPRIDISMIWCFQMIINSCAS